MRPAESFGFGNDNDGADSSSNIQGFALLGASRSRLAFRGNRHRISGDRAIVVGGLMG